MSSCLPTPASTTISFDSPLSSQYPTPSTRVRRNGTRLELDGERYTAVGPNVYWLALDENVVPNPSIPSRGRVLEIMSIAQAMGANTIRAHTLGTNVGTAISLENALGQFSERAFAALDWAVYAAKMYGIRLIIPLTDQYDYYHGGIPTFLRWRNLPADSPKDYGPFYDLSSDVYSDFTDFVRQLITHRSNITGLTLAEEPTIMAFETGNELGGWGGKSHPPPFAWTSAVSQMLKQLAPDTLVIDGHYGVQKSSLVLDSVDIVSDHFYPPYSFNAERSADRAHSGGKAFLAGEYDWTDRYYMPLLYLAILIPAVLAASVWLMPQRWWPWHVSIGRIFCCRRRTKRQKAELAEIDGSNERGALYDKVGSTSSLPLTPSDEPQSHYPPALPPQASTWPRNVGRGHQWVDRSFAIRRWHFSLFLLVLCAPVGAVIHAFMPTPLSKFLPALESMAKQDKLSGSMYWSLFGRDDACCTYVEHNDGYTLHYPSDPSESRGQGSGERVATLTRHAWKLRGKTPSWLPTGARLDQLDARKLPIVRCPQASLEVPANATWSGGTGRHTRQRILGRDEL